MTDTGCTSHSSEFDLTEVELVAVEPIDEGAVTNRYVRTKQSTLGYWLTGAPTLGAGSR